MTSTQISNRNTTDFPNEISQEISQQAPKRARNWSLIIGLILVSLIILLAIIGPNIAPRDPLEENIILQIEGKWYLPPFALFTPGYPLGSDDYGRDMYSRILWAIRPTLVMVLIVAVIRLFLGVIIGLLAGWSSGRNSRSLDNIIETFLSIPVLIVALGAIAVIGVEYGLWAFVIGLSINGWVETAQQVREQTRIVKGQTYIEAAHAIGASNRQMLSRHVLKQIMPMLAMLFAFEISSTLMTTAGLGFLGYYIGGDVWVEVSDFVARRISGMPELGQMLATSWVTLTKPWTMLVVGTTIFITVLGFNLIGEGLRRIFDLAVVRRRGIISRLRDQAISWFDQNVGHPVATAFRKPALRYPTYGLIAVILLILFFPYIAQSVPRFSEFGNLRNVSNQTAEPDSVTAEATPQSGQVTSVPSPEATSPTVQASIDLVIQDKSGFDGSPTISPDGETIYVISNDGILYALQPNAITGNLTNDMQTPEVENHHIFLVPMIRVSEPSTEIIQQNSVEGLLWQVTLPAGGKGKPGIDPSGNIYVSDFAGGLSKINPEGQVVWHYQSEAGNFSLSGPVISPDGNIYYTAGTAGKAYVQAVNSDGEGLWLTPAETSSIYFPLSASKDGKYIFLKENIFLAQTGELLNPQTDLVVIKYFPGEDGNNYLLSGHNIIQWELDGQTLRVIDIAEWDSSDHMSIVAPNQSGVSADSTAWMVYTSPGGSSELVWVTLEDEVLGSSEYHFSSAILAAIRPDLTSYVCGGNSFDNVEAECVAMNPESPEPVWSLDLGPHGVVEGGAWDGERLYVTTSDGSLFAMTEEQMESTVASDIPPTQVNAVDTSGLVWKFPLTEPTFHDSFPTVHEDGSVYFVTEDLVLNRINPDGELAYQFQLPDELKRLDPDYPDYLYPVILPDGTAVIVMENDTVMGVTPDGEMAWEEKLASSIEGHPSISDQNVLYIIDKDAGLYAFDASGLKWAFKSKAAPFSTGGIAFGPNGEVYYTVTTRGKGYVQAVDSDGQELWASAADTGFFYDELFASQDGQYVFLKEDIFDATTGTLLKPEIPVPVYRFIAGEDGNNYLQSDLAVAQWQIGTNGFEILQTAAWQTTRPLGTLPFVHIDENSIIYVNYFDSIIRLTADGELLGEHSLSFSDNRLKFYNYANSTVTECSHDPKTNILTCRAFPIGSEEPLWETSIPNIDSFNAWSAAIVDGYLYLNGGDNTLYKFAIGQP